MNRTLTHTAAALWLVLTAAAVWVVGGAAREGRKGRIVGRKR